MRNSSSRKSVGCEPVPINLFAEFGSGRAPLFRKAIELLSKSPEGILLLMNLSPGFNPYWANFAVSAGEMFVGTVNCVVGSKLLKSPARHASGAVLALTTDCCLIFRHSWL